MSGATEELLQAVPRARHAFFQEGFRLGMHFRAAIEAARARTPQERDCLHYLDEVLRESLALRFPWQPSVRHQLGPSERSPYLDSLASVWPGSAATLDPNIEIVQTLRGGERLEFVERFRRLKQEEQQHFDRLLGEATVAPGEALIDRLIDMAAAQGFGHPARSKGRDAMLSFEGLAPELEGAAMQLLDLSGVIDKGRVLVQYQWPRWTTKTLAIDRFVPGGDLYYDWNKDGTSVLFAFFAQCRLAVHIGTALRASGG